MARAFDPRTLSAEDQVAFHTWQSQLQQLVQQNGGAVSAPVTYALAHPDYLATHPELRGEYNLVSGQGLPDSVKSALKDYNPTWSGGGAGFEKNSGLFSKWETWLQLGLGAGAGGAAAAAALSGAAPAAATAGPALGGGSTLAANLGSASALPAVTAGGGGGVSTLSSLAKLAPYLSSGVGSVLANRTQVGAGQDANAALQQATQQGLGINQGVYQQSLDASQQALGVANGAYAPYQAIGQQGLSSLSSLAGQTRPDFTLPSLEEAQAMPGYQFGLDQGQRGIQASAAARGGLLTGAAVKASDKFATDYATSKYNDLVNQKLAAYTTNTANVDRPFNQAATLASLGQNATSGVVNAANNYASNVRNAGSAYGANATDLITGGANANAGQLLSAGASNTNTYQTLANIVGQALANYRQTGSL